MGIITQRECTPRTDRPVVQSPTLERRLLQPAFDFPIGAVHLPPMQLPRNAQIWLPGLIRSRLARPGFDGPVTVWLTFADHYEPRWRMADLDTARTRVRSWTELWPGIARRHLDHFGRPAQYTFFYPEEEYHPELLEPLAVMARAGVADVEVHIHHDREGEADFVNRINNFVANLRDQHGLLHQLDGRTVFGFIHGNWALDNSHPKGRWCGLNNEITLLRELGCYADFTLPAAPNPCQTRRVNAIYWAVDDPLRPRSHDDGVPVRPGGTPPASSLLMVQGPLTIRWTGLRPTLEVGELAGHDAVTPDRVNAWLSAAPRIGNHLFVKLHGHGAPEKNAAPLLEKDLAAALSLTRAACERRGWQLAHATAWQAYRAITTLARGDDPVAELNQGS